MTRSCQIAQNARYTLVSFPEGYLRPVSQWNNGAQARFKEQKFAHINKK